MPPVHELLSVAELELAKAKQARAELLARLDLVGLEQKILCLEARVGAFREAIASTDKSPSTAVQAGGREEPRTEITFNVDAMKRIASMQTPAQMILQFLRRHPGASTKAVIDALADRVQPVRGKSNRKVVSTAIYDLKRRQKIHFDANGRLVVTEDANG